MYCINHPNAEAKWRCKSCDKYYCDECRVEKVFGAYSKVNLCPVCRNALNEVEGVEYFDIEPFWARIPEIFFYPVIHDGWIVMAGVITAMLFFSILGLPGAIISYCVEISVGFYLLKQSANGYRYIPGIPDFAYVWDDLIKPGVMAILGALPIVILPIVYFIMKSGTFHLGMLDIKNFDIIYLLIMLFVVVSLPMAWIMIAISGRPWAAWNPLGLINAISRTAPSYFILIAFIILIKVTQMIVNILIAFIPRIPVLTLLIYMTIDLYFSFTIFHIMGYFVFQNADELGYQRAPRKGDDLKAPKKLNIEPSGATAAGQNKAAAGGGAPPVYLTPREKGQKAMESGDFAAAVEGFRQAHEQSPENREIHKELTRSLIKAERFDEFRMEAEKLFQDNMSRKDYLEANIMIREVMEHAPQADIPPGDFVSLGDGLREMGRFPEAVKVYYDLARKYPADPLTPRALYLSAGVFLMHLNQKEKARQLLQTLKTRFPDDPIQKKVDGLIKKLDEPI